MSSSCRRKLFGLFAEPGRAEVDPVPGLREHDPPGRPRPEHVIEAVRWLQEGLSIPDVYLRALLDLIEAEYIRRTRAGRRVA